MFTGLIEAVGRVSRVTPIPGGVQLTVLTGLAGALHVGDSIATNGACLTVTGTNTDGFTTDVSPETLRVTALGDLGVGTVVNLERPVRAETLLGGHFVLGHVDTTGTIGGIAAEGAFWRVTVRYPPLLAPLLIPKGSIAIDGISLTVAALRDGEFDVQLIPHTWAQTNLHARRVGERVNLEGDLLGKYVVRMAGLAGWAERLSQLTARG